MVLQYVYMHASMHGHDYIIALYNLQVELYVIHKAISNASPYTVEPLLKATPDERPPLSIIATHLGPSYIAIVILKP